MKLWFRYQNDDIAKLNATGNAARQFGEDNEKSVIAIYGNEPEKALYMEASSDFEEELVEIRFSRYDIGQNQTILMRTFIKRWEAS